MHNIGRGIDKRPNQISVVLRLGTARFKRARSVTARTPRRLGRTELYYTTVCYELKSGVLPVVSYVYDTRKER